MAIYMVLTMVMVILMAMVNPVHGIIWGIVMVMAIL